MALEYFNKYEKYYETLKENSSIVESAKSLSDNTSSDINSTINNYFNRISESNWIEIGKPFVSDNVFASLKNQLTKLNNFISNNLYSACDLSINSLFPKIQQIKDKNKELDDTINNIDSLNVDLKKILVELSQTKRYEPIYEYNPVTKENEKTGTKETDEWKQLTAEKDNIKSQIAALGTTKTTLIELLEGYCVEADQIINSILALDGSLSISQISSIESVSTQIANNFFDSEGNLILPEGFILVEDDSKNKRYYGVLEDGSALIVKVRYENMSGSLYIPLNNSTSNLGLIMLGGDDKDKYNARASYIFQDNDFDSVLFMPNHVNEKGYKYDEQEIKLLSEMTEKIMSQYNLTNISGYAHSNGNVGMIKFMEYQLINNNSIPPFSNVLMHAPSTRDCVEGKENVFKENNVSILIGTEDSYYKYRAIYPESTPVIEISENIEGLIDVRDNNKRLTCNNHSNSWFTYSKGEYIDERGETWNMKRVIDGT